MSNPVPDQLALTSIADDAEIIASDHRNNYSAIQTAVNALITALSGGAAGQALLAADSSDVEWGPVAATYAPTWASSGTAPAIGNGTIVGRYLQIGKLVYAEITVTFGSTTTFGTGDYYFGLPVDMQSDAFSALSSVRAYDTSATEWYAGMARRAGRPDALIPTTLASPTVDFSATTPVTWATGDVLEIAVVYEAD